MHRIDEPGHVDNAFVVGNPATGQIATRMGADFPNAVQEEICNVVEGAGITLEKGTNTQLLQAIQTLSGGPGAALPDPYITDDQEPAEYDSARDALLFAAGADAWTWNTVELWRSGVAWQIQAKLLLTNTDVANVDLRVAYLPVPAGAANPVAKTRWQPDYDYALGGLVIPLGTHLNGYYYECSTAGLSDSSQPTWGTTPGGYTNDGGAVWTCREYGMTGLSALATPPGVAWQDWTETPAGLVIPSGEAGAGDRLHLGIWRRGSADANTGGLLLALARVYPVEV